MTATIPLQDVLELFFERHLKPGICCGSNGGPFTNEEKGKLVYQDGTVCSASFAFSDVLLIPNGTYIVQTKIGEAHFTGDSPDNHTKIISDPCQDLWEVFQTLQQFCGHDPNTVGDAIQEVFDNPRPADVDITPLQTDSKLVQALYEFARKPPRVYNSSKPDIVSPRFFFDSHYIDYQCEHVQMMFSFKSPSNPIDFNPSNGTYDSSDGKSIQWQGNSVSASTRDKTVRVCIKRKPDDHWEEFGEQLNKSSTIH